MSVFLIVGIALSLIDVNFYDPSYDMSLWHACTDFLVVCFVSIPSIHLVRAISYPVVQPEDATCINWSVFGVWVFCITFFIRSIWNFLHYANLNYIYDWIIRELEEGIMPNKNSRFFQFCFSLVFEFSCSIMTMIGVYVLNQHDLKFADDPFYARAQIGHVLISGK